MSSEPQTYDGQPSIDIDWPSDTDSSILLDLQIYDLDFHHDTVPQNNDDLSALLGLDTCALDLTAKNPQQNIKKKAASLLEKWAPSSEREEQTTSSSGQPARYHGTGLGAIAYQQESAHAADSQRSLDNETEILAFGLMEEQALDTDASSEHSTVDHSVDHARISDNGHPRPIQHPFPAVHHSFRLLPNPAVVDLTGDEEVNMATGSGPTSQFTDQSLRISAAKSPQAPRATSPPSSNSESSPPHSARKVCAGPKPASAKSGSKKRKRPDAINNGRDLVSASGSRKHNTPTRQRRQQKTSPGQHLKNEILWMNGSVSRIERMIKDMETEINTIGLKRVLLLAEHKTMLEKHETMLQENETEMQSAQRRLKESTGLKEYLLGWGAQDEKVTKEWSSSG